MTEGADPIGRFLAHSGWGAALRQPLVGDLSSRRYERLVDGDRTAILMVAPPDASLSAFISLTGWLRAGHLSAPGILALDVQAGLLILEDFGDAKLTNHIENDRSLQLEMYEIAIEALARIRGLSPPTLDRPGTEELITATGLVDEWYPGTDATAIAAVRTRLTDELNRLEGVPTSVSLRDFHTDNLIWLPDRAGPARLGLLDYQDAFLIHPDYDLMSLVTDARIDVPLHVFDATLERWCDATGRDHGEVSRAVAALGVQRNLRILGIFCRSARRDGKDHHLPALPRVYGHLQRCLAHPAFADVSGRLAKAVPPPSKVLA